MTLSNIRFEQSEATHQSHSLREERFVALISDLKGVTEGKV